MEIKYECPQLTMALWNSPSRVLKFLQRINSYNSNLIQQHPQRHAQKQRLIKAPHDPLKLTHKISHHKIKAMVNKKLTTINSPLKK